MDIYVVENEGECGDGAESGEEEVDSGAGVVGGGGGCGVGGEVGCGEIVCCEDVSER